MRPRARLIALLIGAAGLGSVYLRGAWRLPAFGHYQGPYGDLVDSVSVPERDATDTVSAVNFDIRGFDTLGEEFILFVSVIGSVVLLRQQDGKKDQKHADRAPGREAPPPSDSVRVWTLGMTGPTVLYGLYIVTHGQLTTGGGFQGGVILATAPVLLYLAGSYEKFHQITSHYLVELGEALGAGGFALIGLLPLLRDRGEFLKNFIPPGNGSDLYVSGTMPWISLATGIEVAAGFVLLLLAFLQDTLAEGKKP